MDFGMSEYTHIYTHFTHTSPHHTHIPTHTHNYTYTNTLTCTQNTHKCKHTHKQKNTLTYTQGNKLSQYYIICGYVTNARKYPKFCIAILFSSFALYLLYI